MPNLQYALYQGLWGGLDWLYPPICGGCSTRGNRWCPDCQKNVQRLDHLTICPTCGQPDARDAHTPCKRCQQHPPKFIAARSWGAFAGPLQHALHRLKYRRDLALGEILARHLIEQITHLNWQFDTVIPVPLSAKRLRERGYNQAALLALPVALALHRAYQPAALQRQRHTDSQVHLNFQQRQQNVSGAFHATPRSVRGKNILVIDDVATTSATLNACAHALLEAGANQVYGLTMARAVFKHQPANSHTIHPE
ncbi:MAG: ComF family protein [Anaerolineales bacterium]